MRVNLIQTVLYPSPYLRYQGQQDNSHVSFRAKMFSIPFTVNFGGLLNSI